MQVVDNYVIILVCVLGGLVVLPLVAWLIRRCVLARRHNRVSRLFFYYVTLCQPRGLLWHCQCRVRQ
jgi:hypothetical protein